MKLIILFLAMFIAKPALAVTCMNDYDNSCVQEDEHSTAGNCVDLGYSTTIEKDCEHTIVCPFNSSYKRCVKLKEPTCAEKGFTLTHKKYGSCFNYSECTDKTGTHYRCDTPASCVSMGFFEKPVPNCDEDDYETCVENGKTYYLCNAVEPQESCSALGFTADDKSSWCDEDSIKKCDNLSLCAKVSKCKIGDVYYADGGCGDVSKYTKGSTRIPVGVVYWVSNDGYHGKVINLHDLGIKEGKSFDPANPYDEDPYFSWGYSGNYHDVPDLKNYNSNVNMLTKLQSRDSDLYNGKLNTDKILADPGPNCSTANYDESVCTPVVAKVVRSFYPLGVKKDDPIVGAGQWYLPALGELMDLYGYDNSQITDFEGKSGAKGDIKTLVNDTLSALKNKEVEAEKLTDSYYWSSSEFGPTSEWSEFDKKWYDYNYAWSFCIDDGVREKMVKEMSLYVRTGLEF